MALKVEGGETLGLEEASFVCLSHPSASRPSNPLNPLLSGFPRGPTWWLRALVLQPYSPGFLPLTRCVILGCPGTSFFIYAKGDVGTCSEGGMRIKCSDLVRCSVKRPSRVVTVSFIHL